MSNFKLQAQSYPLVIDSLASIVSIPTSILFMYEDSTATLNFEQVQTKSFLPLNKYPPLHQRNYHSTWWAKIDIQNRIPFPQTFWVNISGKFVTAYIQSEGQPVQIFQTGNLVPKSQKAIPFPHKFYNFVPLNIPKEIKTITLWAKVTLPETIAGETDISTLVTPLFAENYYHKKRKDEHIFNIFFFTTLFLLILYCFIYFWNTKAAFAKYMMVYFSMQILYFLNQHSYLYNIFDWVAENPIVPNYIHLLFINLTAYADMQLIRHYLNLEKHLPTWNRLFKLLMVLSVIVTLLSVISYYITDNFNWSYLGINGSFSLLFLIFRLVFIFRIYNIKASHRFRIITVALGIGLIFLFIALSGFFIQSVNGAFFFQTGIIVYSLILVISLGKDAAIDQIEKIAAIKKQILQQQSLKLKEQEVNLSKKRAAVATMRQKELEQLNKVKSRFFANVSHEFRTPLTLMLAPMDTILQRKKITHQELSLLQLAHQNGQKLLKLVNEILSLSKLENEQLTAKADTVSLFTFLNRLAASFESIATLKNINFYFEYLPTQNLMVQLDKDKVEKIINNFLSNAFKFTAAGQTITLTTKLFPNRIQISVKDNGQGISETDLPNIFNRYYQSKEPNAPINGGTGIGLALSLELAKLMKGKLWAESSLGQGSSFYFEFPLKKVLGKMVEGATTNEQQRKSVKVIGTAFTYTNLTKRTTELIPSLASTNSTKKKETILVVEDNPELAHYLQTILSPWYQVITAENGQNALTLLANRPTKAQLPQLVISDMMMPIMDGLQLLNHLKASTAFQGIPFIMLTARAALKDKLEALRIGVDDYTLKPFVEAELLARISNLLANFKERQVAVKEQSVGTANTAIAADFNKSAVSTKADQEWLQELEAVVEKNLENTQYSTSQLAQDLFMSRQHLNRRIRKLVGMTASNYLKETRLVKARTLFETGEYGSVKLVANKVGFPDANYFGQVFRQRFGKLPSTYFEV